MQQIGQGPNWSPSSMTPELAATELLRRTEATENLIAFTEYTFDRYKTAPHHRLIAQQLERVERDEIDRLMLLVPPRHGKSELASKRFPAFYLGRHPHRQFISVSATAELAADFGRDVRNLIESPEYQVLFSTKLAEDSKAKGKWHTADGGIYYAIGIDGSVLGRGGDVVLIDDPYASMQDAMSELTRKNVWDWYSGTIYNRLQPGGAIVVINHRMHEDDLSGRLLAQQAAGGDQWTVIELPAINAMGEALWPEAYPLSALERIRTNTQARFWSALYQQRPAPEEGDLFKCEWLKPYDIVPARDTLQVYGGSDYAVTADGGDYTAHCVVGLDPDGRMYLLDLWRKRAASDEWVESFCDLVLKWKPLGWAEEQGQIKSGIGPFLDRRQRERSAYVARTSFPTRGDKAIRAQSIRGRMALEGLYVPVNAPWYPDFRTELLSFPAGRHDDQADALGLVGQLLDLMVKGSKPVPPEKPEVDIGYKDALGDSSAEDWMQW
jgi:predicted phage terminase large subunit-like protein